MRIIWKSALKNFAHQRIERTDRPCCYVIMWCGIVRFAYAAFLFEVEIQYESGVFVANCVCCPLYAQFCKHDSGQTHTEKGANSYIWIYGHIWKRTKPVRIDPDYILRCYWCNVESMWCIRVSLWTSSFVSMLAFFSRRIKCIQMWRTYK